MENTNNFIFSNENLQARNDDVSTCLNKKILKIVKVSSGGSITGYNNEFYTNASLIVLPIQQERIQVLFHNNFTNRQSFDFQNVFHSHQ